MIKKAEIAVAALTALFIVFMTGFFAGRSESSENLVISNRGVLAEVAAPVLTAPALQAPAAPERTAAPDTDVSEHTAAPDSDASEHTAAPDTEPHYTPDGKLRLNFATSEELQELPGIGEMLAERIIEYREEHGAFRSKTGLMNVSGIGEGRFNRIADLITAE